MINTSFWAGKQVLLTGHTGFKGGWLGLWLQQAGAVITGLSLEPPTEPNLFSLARVGDGMTSSIGDIRDWVVVKDVMARSQPDIVLHLAAQPIVRASYDDPIATFMTNVMGTVHVLEAARTVARPRVVLIVSSDKCYENPEWEWGCREGDPMGGHDPYSSSKGCTELVTAAYRRSFFEAVAKSEGRLALASARAGNVIGGGDWARDRLIPDIVRATQARKTTTIRNPRAVRPWQHVLEPLSGYLTLVERLWDEPTRFAGGWNFGPADGDAVPVGDLVERFCKQLGRGAAWKNETQDGALHEANALRLDISKARSRLGWRPRWGLDVGLEKTADWYATYLDGGDLRAKTLEQIEAFEVA